MSKYSKYQTNSKERELQIRLSFQDTLHHQKKLLQFLRDKVKHPVLTAEEAEMLPELVAKALLSTGVHVCLNITMQDGRIVHLNYLHAQLLLMPEWAKSEQVTFNNNGRTFTISTSKIWQAILQQVVVLCPRALSEALSMSREMPRKERSSAYKFTMDEKVE